MSWWYVQKRWFWTSCTFTCCCLSQGLLFSLKDELDSGVFCAWLSSWGNNHLYSMEDLSYWTDPEKVPFHVKPSKIYYKGGQLCGLKIQWNLPGTRSIMYLSLSVWFGLASSGPHKHCLVLKQDLAQQIDWQHLTKQQKKIFSEEKYCLMVKSNLAVREISYCQCLKPIH